MLSGAMTRLTDGLVSGIGDDSTAVAIGRVSGKPYLVAARPGSNVVCLC